MIEIREPKYKVGDKMNFTNHPGIFEVVEMINFNFCINDYFYKVKHMDFGEIFITNEANLEPYIEKPKTVWDLKKGDTYYTVDIDGSVIKERWRDEDYEKSYRNSGNVFLTEEEAEFEVERRKIETEMLRLGGRRKFNRGKDNYFIMYTRIEGLDYVNYHSMHEQGVIYFDSELDAINAVKTIGKDKIKKYIFVE